jgi:aspartyl/asparaginyl beta-hydroxylase (cupin superfamily)
MYYIKNPDAEKISEDNFISLNKYPELDILKVNHGIICQELNHILEKGLWSNYDDLHKKDIFRNNDMKGIMNELTKSESKVNAETTEPKWKVFGLIFNKNALESNEKFCPNTIQLLKSIPCIINAGFSCLEPNKSTDVHSDNNEGFFRYQLPLIIPKGDTGFKVNNESIKYEINEPFIFDDCNEHQAWNYTNKIRVVLICDIERKK